mmetsp:Transcript_21897/g.49961  ORF Transcript_21897/g.49961 Transcript_21897/m.49961 type:complete len:239 (+) Transcript_21897:1844-2560(+)
MLVAVIFPEVSVPVLSLQSTPTQPRVSTASIFRTSTFRLAIFLDAIIKHTVTVGKRPSGTCAKKAVAAFSNISAKSRLRGEAIFASKDSAPTATATYAIMCTKCSIWISNDDLVRDELILAAISPKTVRSPVAITQQTIRPCSTTVPEKATLRDSVSGVSADGAIDWRASAIDSPVRAELSTIAASEHARMRTSAGTRWPASRTSTSPGTNSSAPTRSSRVFPSYTRKTLMGSATCIC